MAALRTLDAIAMMEMPRSRELESTRSKIKAHAQIWLRINHKFGTSWGDTWMPRDASIKIRRAKVKGEHGPASWDHGSS